MVGDKKIKFFEGWRFKNWIQAIIVSIVLFLTDISIISLLISLILI